MPKHGISGLISFIPHLFNHKIGVFLVTVLSR